MQAKGKTHAAGPKQAQFVLWQHRQAGSHRQHQPLELACLQHKKCAEDNEQAQTSFDSPIWLVTPGRAPRCPQISREAHISWNPWKTLTQETASQADAGTRPYTPAIPTHAAYAYVCSWHHPLQHSNGVKLTSLIRRRHPRAPPLLHFPPARVEWTTGAQDDNTPESQQTASCAPLHASVLY